MDANIFFNARGVEIPADNAWDGFRGVEDLRVFAMCAESWRRSGWNVRRLSTVGTDYTPTPFLPDGRVAAHYHWYGSELWQFIAKAKQVAQDGAQMFVTFDVMNYGLKPCAARLLDFPIGVPTCHSFQAEHFSLSCLVANGDWLELAEDILLAYDRGELPEIRATYVSDERILREYLPGHAVPWQKFACNGGDERLVHFARSALARTFGAVPLCP